MKFILLWILSASVIVGAILSAIFFDPKSGSLSGSGWTIPFWPFVIAVGLALNPSIHDLVRLYFKTKIAIAQAENHMPDTSAKDVAPEIQKP